jgi:hypothetical protein
MKIGITRLASALKRWLVPRARIASSRRPSLERLEGRDLPSAAAVPSLRAESASAAPVLLWNTAALEAIRLDQTPPPAAARDLAIVQLSVYEATIKSIGGGSIPEAAIAAAADRALDVLFPQQSLAFDGALASEAATLRAGARRNAGVVLGVSAANAVLASRANDGSAASVSVTLSSTPGRWRPTPPALAPALLPQWGNVTPFALRSVSQFRVPAPPALSTPAYAAAVNQVEALGSATSTTRTADQTQIAEFWNDAAGTSTPAGHWNEIAEEVASRRHLGLPKTARLFAELDVAESDAAIAAWNVKYSDNEWRPITAIRLADQDKNPQTSAVPSWTPLLVTPPFPSYVSGHSTYSAAAATVLSSFFGAKTHFSATSDTLPGVTRSFSSFTQASSEAGMSRIYGGIHFSFDNQAGQRLGRQIGRYDLGHFANVVNTSPFAARRKT